MNLPNPAFRPLSAPATSPWQGDSAQVASIAATSEHPVAGQAGFEQGVDERSFYYQVGGRPVFEKLCREFYARVAQDDEFRAMYPEADLGPAERRLFMFLEQYWGGPKTYQAERGHPRLRMRHHPFAIGPKQRDTWLKYMREAMDTLELSELHDAEMWAYFDRAAHAMQNRAH